MIQMDSNNSENAAAKLRKIGNDIQIMAVIHRYLTH